MLSTIDNSVSPNSTFAVVRMEPTDILILARHFVLQYYTIMRKCPSGIHRFYKDDSSMLREDAPVYGQRMIHEKIMSMNLQDSRIAILRLDALRASADSVLVQVAGEMCSNDEKFRRFTQTFILREQAPCDFYVLNDIFRYQDFIYGDVNIETEANNDLVVKTDSAFTANDDPNREVSQVADDDRMHSWEEMPANTYKQSEDEIHSHENEREHSDMTQLPVEHITVQHSTPPCHHETQTLSHNEEPPQAAPTSQQPRSWAQMASKQPQAAVISSVKASRSTNHVSDYQPSDDHRVIRSSNTNYVSQRIRGPGVRQQGDIRAAQDVNLGQDSRLSGSNSIRTSSSKTSGMGHPRGVGVRGARGGPSNGTLGGRGSGPVNQRRVI